MRQGGRTVWSNSAYLARGKPSCCGSTPADGGTFNVTLSATDPAGNFATATGTIVVSPRLDAARRDAAAPRADGPLRDPRAEPRLDWFA